MNQCGFFGLMTSLGRSRFVALIDNIAGIVRHLRLDQRHFATMMRPQ